MHYKLSPMVRQAALSQQQKPAGGVHNAPVKGTSQRLCALVRIDGDAQKVLCDNGCEMLYQWGNICAASIPLNNITTLSNRKEVKRIEAHRPLSVNLDTTNVIVHADGVRSGVSLSHPYTGKGVIVGVQDIGFELTHPTFYSTSTGEYRIKRFWDMLDADSIGSGLFVGRDYKSQSEILQKGHATDGAKQFHGTMTSSMAAGSGYDTPYIGMASEAELCFVANAVGDDREFISDEVEYKYTSATDLLGFQYIFDYATEQGKPCVISFSEGAHEDLYGECQLLFEVLRRMVGPGRIICASAGNESSWLTYMHKPVGQSQARSVLFSKGKYGYYTLKGNDFPRLKLTFCKSGTAVYEYNLNTCELIEYEDSARYDTIMVDERQYVVAASAFPNCYDTAHWAADLYIEDMSGAQLMSGDMRIMLTLLDEDNDVEIYSSGGYFMNMSLGEGREAYDAQATHNIHFPSSSPDVICVGATSYRTGFYNIHDEWTPHTYGSGGTYAGYSSVGPTMQGIMKPDVVAAGTNVIGAMSSLFYHNYPDKWDTQRVTRESEFQGEKFPWAGNTGTSLSCPVVAGIIALWLEACPTLSPDDIREIIAATSTRYDASLTYPNNYYGYGEIDAMAGIQYILQHDNIIKVEANRSLSRRIMHKGGPLSINLVQPLDHAAFACVYNIIGVKVAEVPVKSGLQRCNVSANLPKGIYSVVFE